MFQNFTDEGQIWSKLVRQSVSRDWTSLSGRTWQVDICVWLRSSPAIGIEKQLIYLTYILHTCLDIDDTYNIIIFMR